MRLLNIIQLLAVALNVDGFLPSYSSVRSSAAFVTTPSSRSIRRPSSSFPLEMARGRRGGNQRNVVKEKKPPMNEEVPEVDLRVVTPTPKGKDEPLGIMSRADALAKAKELGGLDLILVNAKSDPPVCKIVDYSKYRYMQEKKAKEVKKNSKANEVKEVKMSYKIDVHDYDVRKKNALKFLNQGNRVKCTVMFRGREVQHDNLGVQLLDKLALDLEDLCVREGKAKREGRNLSLILSPRPEVMKAVNDNRKAGERAKKKKKADSFAKKKAQDEKEKNATGAEVNGSTQQVVLVEDDDENEPSLEELLGSDDLTDELFS